MLDEAIEKDIFEGKLKIKVLRPEDVIGLKIQAIANDETRSAREFVDIEALMEYYRKDLDWKLLEEYFLIFEQEQRFKQLKERYGNIK